MKYGKGRKSMNFFGAEQVRIPSDDLPVMISQWWSLSDDLPVMISQWWSPVMISLLLVRIPVFIDSLIRSLYEWFARTLALCCRNWAYFIYSKCTHKYISRIFYKMRLVHLWQCIFTLSLFRYFYPPTPSLY